MAAAELLERYSEMLRLSQHMLELARQSDWDRLVEIGLARSAIADDLDKYDVPNGWSRAELAKKAELIRSILAADDEIKILTQAWMGELKEILGSIGTEKKLNNTYETP